MTTKVVLAYSGGLDTSVILKWLIEQGHDVTALIVDLGQKEDLPAAEKKAHAVGASKVLIADAREAFVTEYMFPALRASAIYEGRYLLGTALARPLIAKLLVETAHSVGATHVAHGATGKGNDQVRFELGSYFLDPKIRVIAPWKLPEFLSKFKGRPDLLQYAADNKIPVEATSAKPYSVDANLMHTSYESGVLEDPAAPPPLDMFKLTKNLENTPDTPLQIEIHFEHGVPTKAVDSASNTPVTGPVEIVEFLNTLGGIHGVGRVDMVENRYVGMKSRGVYETPGYTILWKAHQDLELLTLDREVYRIKESMVQKFSDLTYNGYWFSPEMEYVRYCCDKPQENVTGMVSMTLFKGNVICTGRSSPVSLYDKELVSMDVEGDYSQSDAGGFIRTNSVRLRTYSRWKQKHA